MSKVTGIYAIINKVNGKQYIGSSVNAFKRWQKEHLPALNKGQHYNKHLQNAWTKYGKANFEFTVLEECDEPALVDREGWWIEKHKSWDRECGYNLARFIEGRQVCSQETRQQMSQIQIAKWAERLKTHYQTGVYKEVLDLFKTGMSKNAIAKTLKIARNSVYDCLEYNGLHQNEGRGSVIKLTPEKCQEITELREKGLSWREVLLKTGISKTQAYRVLEMKDGKYHDDTRRRTAYRTLTPELEKKAIELREQGKTWKQVGGELGINQATFYRHGIVSNHRNVVRRQVTDEDRVEAMRLRGEGKSWKEISDLTGISLRSLHRIREALS